MLVELDCTAEQAKAAEERLRAHLPKHAGLCRAALLVVPEEPEHEPGSVHLPHFDGDWARIKKHIAAEVATLAPQLLLPVPRHLEGHVSDLAHRMGTSFLAPALSPVPDHAALILRILSTPSSLTDLRQRAVREFFRAQPGALEEGLLSRKVAELLPAHSELFLQLLGLFSYHRPALFRRALLDALGRELVTEAALEAVSVLCASAALSEEYMDALVNVCLRQIARSPPLLAKQRAAVLASFLLQMARSGLYRFTARAATWRARYPEVVAHFPLALTEG